jgi:acetyl esterase/lipase
MSAGLLSQLEEYYGSMIDAQEPIRTSDVAEFLDAVRPLPPEVDPPQRSFLMPLIVVAATAAVVITAMAVPLMLRPPLPDQLPATDGTAVTATSIPAATLAQISADALRDVPYSEDHPRQVVDVYLPTTGDGPYPTILAIHGGAFTDHSKAIYWDIGPLYAANGYAFVAMNYRLTPGNSYPAQLEDSFCALAWLHDNASEYGFDPDQVVVTGGSDGGYLASMLGTVDNPSIYLEDCAHEYPSTDAMQGVAVYYGFYDFTNVDDFTLGRVNGSLKRFWGAAYEDIPAERLKEMSPIAQIDGSEPPFIILHGTADTDIPSVMSERFATALELAGADVQLVLLPDVGHGFERKPLTGPEMTLAFKEVDDFLERTLNP